MSTAPHAPGEFGEPTPRATPARGPAHYARHALKALASLQLTVVLFSLGILLVFFGTMAQREVGIWTVVDKYFYSWVVMVPTELIRGFLTVFWKEQFPDSGSPWTVSFPFPAGKLIGWLMVVNLLAAHAIRFRLTWKRSGVFLIHGGLMLLFAGEFITREYAVEQRITLDKGKRVSFTEDSRFVEYVFIDRSHPDKDVVATIPENLLRKGGRITSEHLPVDVEVVGEFMINADLERPRPGADTVATTGHGTDWVAKKRREVNGLDENKENFPAVYLKFARKGTGENLGTRLGSLMLYRMPIAGPEPFELDGKTYEVVLRYRRYQKPYTFVLDDKNHDTYLGTGKAKNFSSNVRVFEAGNPNPVREQRISMNEPLRYNGETFYQHQMGTNSVLQVVKNPGWLLPYISCIVVGLGLTVHFLIYLIQFLRRVIPSRAAPAAAAEPTLDPAAAQSWLVRWFPAIMVGLCVLFLLGVSSRMAPPKEPVDLDAFGRLQVVEGGRAKPLDTVARVNLRIISGREEFVDEKGDKQPAILWYLDSVAAGGQLRGSILKHKFIRIDNETVLRELKLENREGFRYSLEEIAPSVMLIEQRVRAGQEKVKRGEKLDTAETKFRELRGRLQGFRELASFGGPLLLPPHNGKDWTSLHVLRLEAQTNATVATIQEAQRLLRESKKLYNLTPEEERLLIFETTGVDPDKKKLDPEQRVDALVNGVKQLMSDPRETRAKLEATLTERGAERTELLSFVLEQLNEMSALTVQFLPKEQRQVLADGALARFKQELAVHPAAVVWEKIVTAHRDKQPAAFAAAVQEYRDLAAPHITDRSPTDGFVKMVLNTPFNAIGRNRVEISYNRFAPFYQCIKLYVLAFLLAVVGFAQHAAQRPHWGNALRRSALWVLVLALAVHFLAMLTRMYLMERPLVFVTNLYSSAVFIGCGCVALCLALEWIFPMGVGNAVGALLGLATTIVAHNIASNDTLEMMEAVLDTNFWLATHVTTITFGYTATFVAGFLGALYVQQLLAAVVRDSFRSTGEPTVGHLLAFGAAATGVVGIPLFTLWFAVAALDKFEVMPSFLLQTIYWLTFGVALMYAVGLMLLRVASEGVDEHGRPRAGQIPGLAKPVVAMALTPERSKVFGQMVYGVICFATLLSFVGTVLGGIWADQSWGRFWGWDPKENGAVLIVLWNSLILHARWCGLVKDRGVAVLAIFGNVITAWSWFGTNQLQIGLHSYGFDTRLADACFNFWISQVFILCWGLIPKRFWSNSAKPAAAQQAASQPVNANANANVNANPNAPAPSANGQTHNANARVNKRANKRR
ncbi:MAG: hypothetical protein FJ304_23680 [Planctomycetes bacterium]|nr:hypothetical protein [Planctomycetota bacterium]